MAGALIDPGYGSPLKSGRPQQWFDAEQARVHRAVNVVWPRALGTTPAGMARALTEHSAARRIRYRWRRVRRRDSLTDVCAAVAAGWPVPMLIGSVVPRHWVLLTELHAATLRCYEPSAGAVLDVAVDAVRNRLPARLGFPRAFAFVIPIEA
ncbi:hypothetical protein [Mycolicibacterium sp. CH28]|uniref:hypothetical protein n=1 Tax=Mycolicibacterium sp. CH28 TaxID=2512237 RepID=UPI001F225C75|nr:hypothetical protein [Mycolicibacterium sp. CH28]